MEWLSRFVLLAAALAPTIHAQQGFVNGSGDAVPIWGLATSILGGSSPQCNKTFAEINATGIFYNQPNVAQGPQAGQPENYSGKTLPIGWGVTIENNGFGQNSSQSAASYTLWFDTNGANYTDKYALGYDVCALVGYSLNYNTQLRGQSDNGSCYQTLDAPCINAITNVVKQWAGWLTTPSGGPNSNLTRSSLPGVCRTLSHQLVANFPTECAPFFQDKLDGIAYPLTSYGNEYYQNSLTPNCTMNGTFQNTLTFYNNDSQIIYDAWVDSVTPIIGVWMPIADTAATTTITETSVQFGCGHINKIISGSYQPPALPAPGPVDYSVINGTNSTATNSTTSASASATSTSKPHSDNGLSGGAIAGIVIGVIALVAIIGALAIFLLRRRRSRPKPEPQPEPNELSAAAPNAMVEVSGQDSRYELGENKMRAQLPATKDEGGKDPQLWELDSKHVPQEPVEMPTTQYR